MQTGCVPNKTNARWLYSWSLLLFLKFSFGCILHDFASKNQEKIIHYILWVDFALGVTSQLSHYILSMLLTCSAIIITTTKSHNVRTIFVTFFFWILETHKNSSFIDGKKFVCKDVLYLFRWHDARSLETLLNDLGTLLILYVPASEFWAKWCLCTAHY